MSAIVFSIIVPIYNTKKEYLQKCFDSIKNQYFCKYEVILINDNSSDANIINYVNMISKKNNWKIINNKNNLGLGESRNAGIENSIGEYIVFIDSDDWIDENFLMEIEKFIINNDDLDYINYNFKWIYSDKIVINKKLVFRNEEMEVFGDATAWSKVYKLSFLNKKKIRFYNSKLPHEDEYWFLLILLESKKHASINLPIYNYNKINNNSIMNNLSGIGSLNALNTYLEMFLIFAQNKKLNNNVIDQLLHYYTKPLYILLNFSNIKYYEYKKNISAFLLLKKNLKSLKRINIMLSIIYNEPICWIIFNAMKLLKKIRIRKIN